LIMRHLGRSFPRQIQVGIPPASALHHHHTFVVMHSFISMSLR
jgi:hypothetical protein